MITTSIRYNLYFVRGTKREDFYFGAVMRENYFAHDECIHCIYIYVSALWLYTGKKFLLSLGFVRTQSAMQPAPTLQRHWIMMINSATNSFCFRVFWKFVFLHYFVFFKFKHPCVSLSRIAQHNPKTLAQHLNIRLRLHRMHRARRNTEILCNRNNKRTDWIIRTQQRQPQLVTMKMT